MTKQLSGGKDKMDKKWETAQKEKPLREGLTSMLCFQMALCLAAAGVFFASMRLGGENEDAARNAAHLLCQEEQVPLDTENIRQLWQQFCGFWQGGAGHILEELQDFVAEQIVSPEQLPEAVVGMSEQAESGAGGALPSKGMAAAKGTTLAPYLLSAQLCTPVAGRVTSCFGWREHPISRQADFHKGVDIAAAHGTPVRAALPGVVESVGYNDSYGNYLVIRHSGRLRTTYNHCSEILAEEGEQLSRGDRVALVGSTGISTGPHLHFEIEVEGKKADPLLSLEVRVHEEE